jgi:hypothetical protein
MDRLRPTGPGRAPSVSPAVSPAGPYHIRARRMYPHADRVTGTGPWAAVTHCLGAKHDGGVVTVSLWPTREAVYSAPAFRRHPSCENACRGHSRHWLVRLTLPEPINTRSNP